MYLVKVEEEFDSAHFLSDYDGKCKNIHGHRWKIEVEIGSEKLQESGQCKGMVVDFSHIKVDLKQLADEFDHCLIIEEGTLKAKTLECLTEEGFRVLAVGFRPTAENFAEYFFGVLEKKGYFVRRVLVYETPKNCAIYERM